jgi:hypothetical protein
MIPQGARRRKAMASKVSERASMGCTTADCKQTAAMGTGRCKPYMTCVFFAEQLSLLSVVHRRNHLCCHLQHRRSV